MLKSRKMWVALLALLLAASVGAVALKKRAEAKVEPAPIKTAAAPDLLELLGTDVMQLAPGELRRTLPLSGSLRAVNQAAVKAKLPGEVREVLVREGEPVQAGQLLVKMDGSEYQARLEQARGALQAARGQLDIAAKTRDNNQALFAKGFISQTALDNAASQYAIAQANVDTAKGALDVAQKALNDTVLRAPISGLVSSRSIQPGEKVSADNRLLDVVDLRKMELEAAVPSAEIMNVATGQEVQVRVEGLQQALPGKVVRINPAIQAGTRSVLVYIQIDNPNLALRAGMFGEAQLTLAKKSGVLSLPLAAVRDDGGKSSVYAIEDGKLVQKAVVLGLRGAGAERDSGAAGSVEIVQGLAPGATVVKGNLGLLKSGAAVRIAK